MIATIDTGKLCQIQHSFMIKKKLKKLGIGRSYLNIIKVIYNKLTANIVLNGEKLIRVSTFFTLIQYSTLILSQGSKKRERKKGKGRSQIIPICR
jgi:hypothetical protein